MRDRHLARRQFYMNAQSFSLWPKKPYGPNLSNCQLIQRQRLRLQAQILAANPRASSLKNPSISLDLGHFLPL